jgi:two-component system, LytTR family, sensor kinase
MLAIPKLVNFQGMASPTISLSRSKVFLGYMAWWILWGADQVYLLLHLGFDMKTSLIDATVTQVIFAMAGYTMNTSMHSYRPSAKNTLYIIGWAFGLAAISLYLQRETLLRIIEGEAYRNFFYQSTMVRAAFGWLMIMLVAVLTWTWVYIMEKQESEERRNEAVKLARETELANLRQQLQPHFLFNSLNSINALVMTQPEEARKMVQQLSDFLRGTIRKGDQSLVSLDDELKHLQLYLDIEKVRFGHRLKTEIDFADARPVASTGGGKRHQVRALRHHRRNHHFYSGAGCRQSSGT